MKTWKKIALTVLGIALYYNLGAVYVHVMDTYIVCHTPDTWWKHALAGGWDFQAIGNCVNKPVLESDWMTRALMYTMWIAPAILTLLSWIAYALWLVFGGIATMFLVR